MQFSPISLLSCENIFLFCQEGTIILHLSLSLPVLEDNARGKQTMLCPLKKTVYLQPFILETRVLERVRLSVCCFSGFMFFPTPVPG